MCKEEKKKKLNGFIHDIVQKKREKLTKSLILEGKGDIEWVQWWIKKRTSLSIHA